MTFDPASRMVALMDANGNTTTNVFDAAGQTIATVNAIGFRTTYVFDEEGRQVALLNARGYRTTNVFDQRSQQIQLIDPLGRITTSGFDGAGQQTLRVDARGYPTTYGFDRIGRNTLRSYLDGSLATFAFDQVSNRTAMQGKTGFFTFAFTSLNQLSSVIAPSGFINTNAYDPIGNRNVFMSPDGEILTFQFDLANRNDLTTFLDGRLTTQTYDPMDRRLVKSMPNGTLSSLTYDAASRMIESCDLKSTGVVICDLQFGYDPVGNKTTILDNTGDRVTWKYDKLHQLIDDHRTGSGGYRKTFTYDPVGNCLVRDVNGVLTTSTFDEADQIVNSTDSTGVTVFGFDANGNQSLVVTPAGDRTTSTWSFENQVEIVKLPSGSIITAYYTPDNRRARVIS